MKGNFQMGDNLIYGVKLSVDQTSAAPRKYIDDDLKVKADKTSLNNYLRKRTYVRPFMYANVTSTRNHITGSSLELIQEAILHLKL